MDNWGEIRDLWLEVREYKWNCHNIPEDASRKIIELVRMYKAHHPQTYLNNTACKLPQTITTIGRTLLGRGLIDETLLWKR